MIALELDTKIIDHRIDITSQVLPVFAERARVIVLLPDEETQNLTMEEDSSNQPDFMRLPLVERRRIMAQQAEEMLAHYAQTEMDRQDWQAGEFVDAD